MNARGVATLLLVVTLPLLGACSASGAAGSPNGANAGGSTFVPGTGGNANAGGDTTNATNGGTGNVASSGGDTAVGGGGSGPVAHDSTLFAWPEGVGVDGGGGGGLCRAGHYVGTYSCTVHGAPANATDPADAGPVIYDLVGPVDMVLQEGQSGEFLSVSGGQLTSSAVGIDMKATIGGSLNCQNGAFAGTLQNGNLGIFSDAWDGTMNSLFSPSGPALNGTWALYGRGALQGLSCIGPWSATWQAN